MGSDIVSQAGLIDRDRVESVLRADYARFPQDQTYDLYALDVYFKDPTSEFRGRDRYERTIAFIARWFQEPVLDLHSLTWQSDRRLRTDWTLRWTTPLPWRPRIAIDGWSELTLNEAGLIAAHVDYWSTPIASVIGQHFKANQPASGS